MDCNNHRTAAATTSVNSWEMLNSSRSSWFQLFHSPMRIQNFQSLELFYSFLFRVQNIKCNCQAMQISFAVPLSLFHSWRFIRHALNQDVCVFSFLAYRHYSWLSHSFSLAKLHVRLVAQSVLCMKCLHQQSKKYSKNVSHSRLRIKALVHSFCVHYKFYPFSYLKDLNRFNAASYSFSYRFIWTRERARV